MNVLHINSNYEQSSIYKNMVLSFLNDNNIQGRVYYPTSKPYQYNDIDKEFVDNSVCLNKFDRYFYFSRNRKFVRDINEKYDLCDYSMTLAYSLFSNGYIAYSLYKKYKLPYSVIIQNTDVNFYFKNIPLLRPIGRKIIKNASKVIYISKPYKKHVIDRYLNNEDKQEICNKSLIIPFGIDNYWLENKNMPKDLNKKSLNLLFVGKVNENKNIRTTIAVCKELIRRKINVCFTIVGTIEDIEIKSLIDKYNFIKYISHTNKKELLSIYRKNDIFIMTSFRESFGLVYPEAMSQGLPVIYTKGQGFDQHFKNGEIGYAVNPTNIEEIIKAIQLIQENYNSISSNSIKHSGKFEWKSITLEYKKKVMEQFKIQ